MTAQIMRNSNTQPAIIGPRLRVLRLRYGLRLLDVAALTGLRLRFLSRLEQGLVQEDSVKPGALHTVLDAIGATEQERRAVFYKEQSPLTGEQVREEVTRAATLFEEAATPTALLDEHWNWLYLNRSGRLVFGLTGEEYSRLLGSHTLLHLVDVASPMYNRFPDELRRIYFSWKIASFKFHFGEQEFCNWYRDVESAIAKVEWARRTWCNPLILSTLMDSHEVTLLHPTAGELHLRDQLNRHMRSARFSLLEWMPTDAVTALKVEALASPEEWLQIEKVKGHGSVQVEVRLWSSDKAEQEGVLPLTDGSRPPCLNCLRAVSSKKQGKLLN